MHHCKLGQFLLGSQTEACTPDRQATLESGLGLTLLAVAIWHRLDATSVVGVFSVPPSQTACATVALRGRRDEVNNEKIA